MIKKIMFLGAAFSQVPAIKYAKKTGFYVITVDFLPSNPGHVYSDEYYNISTIDKGKVLALAKRLKINAISAYASDPSALTAAYVSEKIGLFGGGYDAVETLSLKGLFRSFLEKNGFLTPWYVVGQDLETIVNNYPGGTAIIKPVDSSGSKGVFKINNLQELKDKFLSSIVFSMSGQVILEQFIKRKGPQIHGEGFVLDGEVVFLQLGDQIFAGDNDLIPYSTMIPSIYHMDIMASVCRDVSAAIKALGFQTGGVNVEVIRGTSDEIYILEIGARNGGNFMPQLMKHATGFDIVRYNVESLFNHDLDSIFPVTYSDHHAQVILHTNESGVFKEVRIPDVLINNIVEKIIYYNDGDQVSSYKSSKDVVGVIIIRITNEEELHVFKNAIAKDEWVIIYKN